MQKELTGGQRIYLDEDRRLATAMRVKQELADVGKTYLWAAIIQMIDEGYALGRFEAAQESPASGA